MKFEYALPLTKGSVVRVVDHLDPLKPFIECTVEDIKEKFFVDGDDLVQLKFSIQKDVLAEARLGHIVTPVIALRCDRTQKQIDALNERLEK
jgi:hypothetical protein